MTFTARELAEIQKLSCDLHAATCKPCGARREDLVEFLTQALDYFDQRADCDEPEPGRRVPNEAMYLQIEAQRILDALVQEQGE